MVVSAVSIPMGAVDSADGKLRQCRATAKIWGFGELEPSVPGNADGFSLSKGAGSAGVPAATSQ